MPRDDPGGWLGEQRRLTRQLPYGIASGLGNVPGVADEECDAEDGRGDHFRRLGEASPNPRPRGTDHHPDENLDVEQVVLGGSDVVQHEQQDKARDRESEVVDAASSRTHRQEVCAEHEGEQQEKSGSGLEHR